MSHASDQRAVVRQFFSDFAETWDSLYGGKRNAFWRAFDSLFRRDVYQRYQFTFERLGPDLRGKSVLDIGCGSGTYCFEAARRGAARVIGVDVADDMIAHARSGSQALGLQAACEFIRSPFPPETPLPALQRTYDYGIAMGVMDYVADATGFLRSARPLITEALFLSFPGRHWLRAPLRRYRYRLLRRPDVYTYDEATIRQGCEGAGFGSADILRLDHSGICYLVSARP
ncbi:MAG TPA: methyltransferase domain-containing protein [Gemmatimonadales bacterium]|nr:methyltransferase domain-containing protein [Gemmatimonadales bacterium]